MVVGGGQFVEIMSCVDVKVEPHSTFTFTHDTSHIDSILFANVNFRHVCARKNYVRK